MYKKLAASSARFHWGSKVGVGKLDDIDREVYERRKTQRRFDIGDMIQAAGLAVDVKHSWQVEYLYATRAEFERIPEDRYRAILATVMRLGRSPAKKGLPNQFNQQLRRLNIISYRISFCIEPPNHVVVFRVVADKTDVN